MTAADGDADSSSSTAQLYRDLARDGVDVLLLEKDPRGGGARWDARPASGVLRSEFYADAEGATVAASERRTPAAGKSAAGTAQAPLQRAPPLRWTCKVPAPSHTHATCVHAFSTAPAPALHLKAPMWHPNAPCGPGSRYTA